MPGRWSSSTGPPRSSSSGPWPPPRRVLPPGQEIVVHKNNSDGKGNSYGCHENYLMDRSVPFGRIVAAATTHFVTRQVFTGAGKVGVEASGASARDVAYQLSQRADFFEAEVGLETTLKRPIVNTRDEPHADAQRYRRLHVIAGDANLAEVATFLKVGTTAVVLAMVEDDVLDRDLTIRGPVAAVRAVSHDPGLSATIETIDGVTMTALEVQFELLDRARKWAEQRGLSRRWASEVGVEILQRWEEVLTGLETDPESRRRPGRLGGQAPPHRPLARAPRRRLDRPPGGRLGPPVPRPAARAVPGRPGRAGARSPTTPPSIGPSPSRRPTPGPTSGAAAWRSSAPASWPPTGTRWCSTWATSPCAGCP